MTTRTNEFRPCAIAGCDGNASAYAKGARGWCGNHYYLWRKHGDPLERSRARRGSVLRWLEDHVGHQGEDCLIWPFAKADSGYPSLAVDGVISLGHREMCRRAHGEPPSPTHQAAHFCGNGHLGCINPRHLRWATPSENAWDTVAHGTRKRRDVRLTLEEAADLKSLKGNVPAKTAGARFGLEAKYVREVWSGRIYRDA